MAKNTYLPKNQWTAGVSYVLGSEIPSTGGDGAALFYDSLDLPADATKQYRFEQVQAIQAPATISIDLNTTAATIDSNANDGVYTYQFRAYEKDGANPEVDLGVITATFIFGNAISADIAFTIPAPTFNLTNKEAEYTNSFEGTEKTEIFSGRIFPISFAGFLTDGNE